ncbi:glucosaminidase domain-containing protein [Trichococcus alkaliphilus]|uniref:glucosaminidase domain-containing protein n=1 Tax=Trichococcus alkaliphilus TaxID=2052943 RepID=UPI00137514A6|nr:glucosaminidase domain-containing protein [Trichococcus alkaliphilus]
MRQVLHKVKSQWIVVGVTGATVVALGIANVQQVSAAEMDDVGIAGNTGQAGNPLIPNEPITLVSGETLIEDAPNFTAEIDDSTLEEGKTEVLQDDNAPVIDSSSINISKVEVMEGESIRVSVRITYDVGIASASIAYLSPITARMETIPLFKNEISGLFEGAFTVTDATELGAWECSIIEAFDTQGHSTLLSGSDTDLSGAVFTVNETTATTDTKSVTEATSVEVLQASAASEEVTAISAAVIAPMQVQETPVVNLETEGTVSTSVNFDNISYATDTQTDNTADYARGASGLQWVQVDLGASYDLNGIQLWHYYGDGRSYHDVVVQLSDDATFSSGAVTVFNNDKDGSAGMGVGADSEYNETSAGKTIVFDTLNARYARFYSNGSTVNGANHYVEIEVYGSEPQAAPTVNLVPEGTLSSSVPFDNSSFATDKLADNTADYARGTYGLQWVQVDLGSAYDLDEVKLWHYFGDGRSYRDVVVQLSNDASFSNGTVTVFNNDKDGSAGFGVGTDSEYSETSAGKSIAFDIVNARYARLYSNGSTVNGANHYVEIEVYGSEPQAAPTVNLVPEGTLSSSVPFDNSSFATDKLADNTADYARGTYGLQWVQVDLGSAYNLDEVKIWHYFGDGRSYRDVVVQLSNDAIFTNGAVTVFNNDKDGSAGLGVGTDSEYSETSAGKMISFAAVNARYARFYSNGSTVNGANHYVEIEVYGSEAEVVEVRTETFIENKIGFVSREQKDNEIPAGERVIIQIGANGYDTVTYDVMYINGVEINRAEVKRLTVAPVNEVVKVGAFIDSQVPTAIVDTQYDSERNVVNIHLSVADDDQVKYMYDPTGKVYEGNELFYSVGSNGIYEFIVVDDSGNSLTIKVDVTAIIMDTSIDYALVENRIMELLNNLRAEQGLSILIKNDILKLAADQRAIETEALFSHTRPNGTANSTIVENKPYFYNYQAFGENLVMFTYSGNEKIMAEFLFEAWLNSLGHLANMRSINYQEVGIGIHYSKGILYAVQLFGTQQVVPIAGADVSTADGGGKYHRVVDGDTLWDIALTYNQTMKQLLIWNDISDANALFPGNLISIDGYNRYDEIVKENQHFASNDEFFEYVVPLAKQMAVENGLYASVMIAQMILESSWGTSDLTTLANNLFGVKGLYDGNTIVMPTWEEENGEKYLIDAGFRVYPDLAASMLDYVELLLNGVDWDTNRYAETWVANTASYEDATACLTNRYATDSAYGEKLNNLIVMNKLWQYDSE